MKYTHLGRTGLQVSRLALGTMNFGFVTDEAASFDIMDAAIDAGINLFDTADVHGGRQWPEIPKGYGVSEEIIGRWLQRGGRRDRIVLATKVYQPMETGPNDRRLSAYHIRRACEDKTLARTLRPALLHDDILWLARRFLDEAAPDKPFSEEAEQALLTHDWSGNARELKHAVERDAIPAGGATLGVAALFGAEETPEEAAPASLADFVAQSERRYIARTLDECEGHLGRTAKSLGISRKNLWEKMKKLGLSANGAQA